MTAKFVTNWKTTVAGICSLALGLLHLSSGQADGVALITSGIGLVFAQDSA